MLIFLIGFMGSGKSTAGTGLAADLGYRFADLDTLIEEREGMAITGIFASKGEDYFRKVEADVLDSLLPGENTVVACGGGTPCFHDNMRKMKSAGLTVYFKASPAMLAGRLSGEHKTRPLVAGLHGEELKAHIRKLLRGREGWYRQSDIIYDADNFDAGGLLEAVRSKIPGDR